MLYARMLLWQWHIISVIMSSEFNNKQCEKNEIYLSKNEKNATKDNKEEKEKEKVNKTTNDIEQNEEIHEVKNIINDNKEKEGKEKVTIKKLSKSLECNEEDSSRKKIRLDTDINTKNKEKISNTPSDLSTSSSRNKDTEVLTNTIANHYNSLEEQGLFCRNQSRIVYMRNFNNWIKSMLIMEYVEKARQGKCHADPLRVLDMCCGKGGDLFKWRKANISYLICADIAEVSIEQCQSRYKELGNKRYIRLFNAEFLACDCTKVRLREKYKDPSMQLDIVSCQFAFHYSFETLPQAEQMLKNASESLRPDGYFIGTIPNAYELVVRWQKTEGDKFGNDVYSVEFQCDKDKPPLFGAKYNFHLDGVVNCPEFLVHQPTFCKLASKFGLELIMFESFRDFYERKKGSGKTLLSKMQAFETYPPYHQVPLLAENSEEYQHAVDYMQSSTGHHKIGTFSLSEWEVISLYSVFAFRKAKTIWNAEGKPEFVKNSI